MRYWADENPHWMRDSHTQYKQKVNVWAGILCNEIVGPFFIDGNLTAEKYLDMLYKKSLEMHLAMYGFNKMELNHITLFLFEIF